MKKPTPWKKPTITTHDHAPAPYHTLDLLALSRAADCDDSDNAVQGYRVGRIKQLELERVNLSCELERAKVQAALDKKWMAEQLIEYEFQLTKAQAERTACVLVIVLTAILGVMVAFGGAV